MYIYIYIYIFVSITTLTLRLLVSSGCGATAAARRGVAELYPHIGIRRWGRPHRLGLPMVVCVECLPADKPWDVVSATRWSSGVAPWACVRVYAHVLAPPNLYIHAYI